MARTARLTKNCNGTCTLRVIVPIAQRPPSLRRRELRLSLRTKLELAHATILALQFGLNPEN
jgi:hypothetical protein